MPELPCACGRQSSHKYWKVDLEMVCFEVTKLKRPRAFNVKPEEFKLTLFSDKIECLTYAR